MAYVNLKGNMPRWTKIYAIFGTVAERQFREKFKAQKHIQIFSMLRSRFFSAKHARWWSRVMDFFQDSRIRVKPSNVYFSQSFFRKWASAIFGEKSIWDRRLINLSDADSRLILIDDERHLVRTNLKASLSKLTITAKYNIKRVW